MTEPPPSPTTIIETLRFIGLSDARVVFQESDQGWRIRAEGGPVVHVRKNGRLTISGKKSNVLREKLGLAGRSSKKKPGFAPG